MTKTFILILVVLFGLGFAGCGPGKTALNDGGPAATSTGATTSPEAAVSSPEAGPSATAVPPAPDPTEPPPTSAPPLAQATSPPRPVTPPPPVQPAGPIRFEVTATGLRFDKTELRAKTGVVVTAAFRNNDTAVQHNLSFSVPQLPHGDTCAGPCTTTQTFAAPAPGRYNFFCTIHDTMVGDLIVE